MTLEERRQAVLDAARKNDFVALEKWFNAAKQEDLRESLAEPLYRAMTDGKDFGEFLEQAKPFISKVGELHIPMNILLMNCDGDKLELVLNALDKRLKNGEFDYQLSMRMAGQCSYTGDAYVVFGAPWLTGKDLELIAVRAKYSLEAKDERRLIWGPISLYESLYYKAHDRRCTGKDLKVVLAAADAIAGSSRFKDLVIPGKLGPLNQNLTSDIVAMEDFIAKHPDVVLCALSKKLEFFRGASYESREDVVKWRNALRQSDAIMGLLGEFKAQDENAKDALRILNDIEKSDKTAMQRAAPAKKQALSKKAHEQAID